MNYIKTAPKASSRSGQTSGQQQQQQALRPTSSSSSSRILDELLALGPDFDVPNVTVLDYRNRNCNNSSNQSKQSKSQVAQQFARALDESLAAAGATVGHSSTSTSATLTPTLETDSKAFTFDTNNTDNSALKILDIRRTKTDRRKQQQQHRSSGSDAPMAPLESQDVRNQQATSQKQQQSQQRQQSGETLSSYESDYDLLLYLGETETEDIVDTERSLDYQDQTWRQSICGAASLAPTLDESLSELLSTAGAVGHSITPAPPRVTPQYSPRIHHADQEPTSDDFDSLWTSTNLNNNNNNNSRLQPRNRTPNHNWSASLPRGNVDINYLPIAEPAASQLAARNTMSAKSTTSDANELDRLLAEMSQSLDLDSLARYDTSNPSRTTSRTPPAPAKPARSSPLSSSSKQAAIKSTVLDEYDGASRILEQMISEELNQQQQQMQNTSRATTKSTSDERATTKSPSRKVSSSSAATATDTSVVPNLRLARPSTKPEVAQVQQVISRRKKQMGANKMMVMQEKAKSVSRSSSSSSCKSPPPKPPAPDYDVTDERGVIEQVIEVQAAELPSSPSSSSSSSSSSEDELMMDKMKRRTLSGMRSVRAKFTDLLTPEQTTAEHAGKANGSQLPPRPPRRSSSIGSNKSTGSEKKTATPSAEASPRQSRGRRRRDCPKVVSKAVSDRPEAEVVAQQPASFGQQLRERLSRSKSRFSKFFTSTSSRARSTPDEQRRLSAHMISAPLQQVDNPLDLHAFQPGDIARNTPTAAVDSPETERIRRLDAHFDSSLERHLMASLEPKTARKAEAVTQPKTSLTSSSSSLISDLSGLDTTTTTTTKTRRFELPKRRRARPRNQASTGSAGDQSKAAESQPETPTRSKRPRSLISLKRLTGSSSTTTKGGPEVDADSISGLAGASSPSSLRNRKSPADSSGGDSAVGRQLAPKRDTTDDYFGQVAPPKAGKTDEAGSADRKLPALSSVHLRIEMGPRVRPASTVSNKQGDVVEPKRRMAKRSQSLRSVGATGNASPKEATATLPPAGNLSESAGGGQKAVSFQSLEAAAAAATNKRRLLSPASPNTFRPTSTTPSAGAVPPTATPPPLSPPLEVTPIRPIASLPSTNQPHNQQENTKSTLMDDLRHRYNELFFRSKSPTGARPSGARSTSPPTRPPRRRHQRRRDGQEFAESSRRSRSLAAGQQLEHDVDDDHDEPPNNRLVVDALPSSPPPHSSGKPQVAAKRKLVELANQLKSAFQPRHSSSPTSSAAPAPAVTQSAGILPPPEVRRQRPLLRNIDEPARQEDLTIWRPIIQREGVNYKSPLQRSTSFKLAKEEQAKRDELLARVQQHTMPSIETDTTWDSSDSATSLHESARRTMNDDARLDESSESRVEQQVKSAVCTVTNGAQLARVARLDGVARDESTTTTTSESKGNNKSAQKIDNNNNNNSNRLLQATVESSIGANLAEDNRREVNIHQGNEIIKSNEQKVNLEGGSKLDENAAVATRPKQRQQSSGADGSAVIRVEPLVNSSGDDVKTTTAPLQTSQFKFNQNLPSPVEVLASNDTMKTHNNTCLDQADVQFLKATSHTRSGANRTATATKQQLNKDLNQQESTKEQSNRLSIYENVDNSQARPIQAQHLASSNLLKSSTTSQKPAAASEPDEADWSVEVPAAAAATSMISTDHKVKGLSESVVKEAEVEPPPPQVSKRPERKLISMTSIIHEPEDELMNAPVSRSVTSVPSATRVSMDDLDELLDRVQCDDEENDDDDDDDSFAVAAASRQLLMNKFSPRAAESSRTPPVAAAERKTSVRQQAAVFDGSRAVGETPAASRPSTSATGSSLVRRLAKNFDQTVQEQPAGRVVAPASSARATASPQLRKLASLELNDEPKSDSTWYDAKSAELLDEAEVAELLREFGGPATSCASSTTEQFVSVTGGSHDDEDPTLSDTGRKDPATGNQQAGNDDDDPTLNDDAETLDDDDEQDLNEELDESTTYASAAQTLQQPEESTPKGNENPSPPTQTCASPGAELLLLCSRCQNKRARDLNGDGGARSEEMTTTTTNTQEIMRVETPRCCECRAPNNNNNNSTQTTSCDSTTATDELTIDTIKSNTNTTTLLPTTDSIDEKKNPQREQQDSTGGEKQPPGRRRFSQAERAKHEAMFSTSSLKNLIASSSQTSLNGLLTDCPLNFDSLNSRHLVKAAKKCSKLYDELERLLAARVAAAEHSRPQPVAAAAAAVAARRSSRRQSTEAEQQEEDEDDDYEDDDDDDDDDEESVLTSDQSRDDQISLSSSSLSSETLPEIRQRKNLQKLYNIVNEICTSEEKFIETLRLLNVYFRAHICTSVGTQQQQNQQTPSSFQALEQSLQQPPYDCVNSLLKHLPQLQALNENLLDELRRARDAWPKTQKISHVLVKIGPFLKHYSGYIRDFELAQQQYQTNLRKYPHFAQLIKQFETKEADKCCKLSIQHHLLKPIQRIPQYRLLLQQYLHHLKPDDADYEDTVSALEVMSRVAEHANHSLSEGANFSKLLALQAKIVGKQRDIIQPGRLFVREGELLKVCRKQIQPRWLVLLSDSLLYLKQIQASDILYLKYELPLDDCQVAVPGEEDDDDKKLEDTAPEGLENRPAASDREFNVHTTVRSMTLVAASRQERDDWVQELRRTIDERVAKRRSFKAFKSNATSDQADDAQKKNSQLDLDQEPEVPINELIGRKAPIWTPDSRVTRCQSCTSTFSALYRRHHCRACGRVVCSACSSNKAPLIYLKCRAARVCDQCFDQLRANLHLYYLPSSQIDERDLRRLDEHFKTLLKSQFVRHVRNWSASTSNKQEKKKTTASSNTRSTTTTTTTTAK